MEKQEETPERDKNVVKLAKQLNKILPETTFDDVYDIAAALMSVHSKTARDIGMNEDFVIASFTQYEVKFVRNMFKNISQMAMFLDVEETTMKRAVVTRNKKKTMEWIELPKEDKKKIKSMRDKTVSSFKNDIAALAILSRAEGGKLLKSYLSGIWKSGQPELEEKRTLMDRIRGRSTTDERK